MHRHRPFPAQDQLQGKRTTRYPQAALCVALLGSDSRFPPITGLGGRSSRSRGAAAGVSGGAVAVVRPRSRSHGPNAEQYWGRAVRPSLFSLDEQAQAVSSPGSIAGKMYHTLPPGSLVRGTTGLRDSRFPPITGLGGCSSRSRRSCRCFQEARLRLFARALDPLYPTPSSTGAGP
jgi:hypothetical protein